MSCVAEAPVTIDEMDEEDEGIDRLADQAAFLEAFERVGLISRACKITEVDQDEVYQWLADDESFAVAFEEAEETFIDRLEGEATKRATVGVKKAILKDGVEAGSMSEYSDLVLMFLLVALRPEKYGAAAGVLVRAINAGNR